MITQSQVCGRARSISTISKALSREGLPARRANPHDGGAEGAPGLDLHKVTGDGKVTRDTTGIPHPWPFSLRRWGIT